MKSRIKLAIDIETFSSVDLGKAGVYKYTESDDFEITLFGFKLDDNDVEVIDLTKENLKPEIINLLYDKNVLKTAYNANFEYTCLNTYLTNNGYPVLPLEQWEDTMLLSAYAGFGGTLEKTAEALNIPQRKDKSGRYLIKKFSSPRKPSKNNPNTRIYPQDDPESWEQFIEYNRQDVVVECAIREKLEGAVSIPDTEQAGWLLDQRINTGGIRIDTELVDNAIELDKAEKTRLITQLKQITGLANPNSNQQILSWLTNTLGEEITSVRKEVLPELIEKAREKDCDEVITVLEMRKELAKTSLAKYYALESRTCKDSRIRGVLQFYGSRTGRWAGRGVQVQNLPRNHLPAIDIARKFLKEADFESLKLFYGADLSDTASQLIRSSFIPDDGKVFAVADYSAIEARVIAWLSNEEWRLDVFKNKGGRIYEASAAQMFGVDFDKICDKNAPEHELRSQGKVAELALGYQGSVGAIARMDFNNAIPEEDRARIVRQWREASPRIVSLWSEVEQAALSACKTPRTVFKASLIRFKVNTSPYPVLEAVLPSGRSLYYPYPEIGKNRWGKESISYQGLNQMTRKIERISMYGGKFVENLIQSIARDCLAESLLKLDETGYQIRFHVHDEIIVEVDEDKAENELRNIIDLMCTPPKWAPDLPLNAAGFISPFYMKD